MKQNSEHEEAALLFSALVQKGATIFKSELNINLGGIYYHLGDCILRQIEQ